MYHEEKIINGVLHWRGAPDGEWVPYTIGELSAMVVNFKTGYKQAREELKRERESRDRSFSNGVKHERKRLRALLGL